MLRSIFVLAGVLLAGWGTTMADETLLTLGSGLEAANVTSRNGAKLSVEQGALRVAASAPVDEPGFTLKPAQGKWDLSDQLYVAVDVRNVDQQPITVRCRLMSPGSKPGKTDTTGQHISLAPGQSGTITVWIPRGTPEWSKVQLFGMRGYPWGMSLDYRDSASFASNVTGLQVFLLSVKGPQSFEVTAIRAAGEPVQPSRLLSDPDKFLPFIDEFGQYIHANWPGKTHSLAELAQRKSDEEKDLAARPAPAGWDQYGGWKDGPALKATGFFYAAKHEGKWWLVDPDGRLFFSNGMDCVTPSEGTTRLTDRQRWFKDLPAEDSEFKDCYRDTGSGLDGYYKGKTSRCFDFGRANLMRKYGKDWQQAFADMAHRRLRSWGINTIANWSSSAVYMQKKTPYTANVNFRSKLLSGSEGYWGKFRDVFDPDFAAQVKAAMARQPDTFNDPWCIGYFVDNEIAWGDDDVSLALAALASPADQVAKKVFIDDLKAKYSEIEKLNTAWGTNHASWDDLLKATTTPDAKKAHNDLAAFDLKTADMYFRTIRDAVKAAAPNHLYLGCRFAWANRPAVEAAAKYCDVVSFNIYRHDVVNYEYSDVADVPMMIGEFHFGALDRGMFHTGLVPTENQDQRAQAYRHYVQSVLADPHFVGCHWFKYMDEPTTSRPHDEENYQIGFLDIVDTPYAETIAASRQVGAEMYEYRMKAR